MKSENPSPKPNKKRKKRFFLIGKWIKWVSISLMLYSAWSCWDIYHVGHSDDGGSADCAIVLGAAAWHKKPSPVLAARLDHAIALYKEKRVTKLILTGGKGNGAEYAESKVSYDYCIEQGVAKEDMIIEEISLTTKGNLQQANTIMQREGHKTALIVSDPWHLKRAQVMAEDLDMFVKPSATQTSKYESFGAKTSFLLREFALLQVYYLFSYGG